MSRFRLTEVNVFFFFSFFDYGPEHTVQRVLMPTRSGRSPLEEPSESNFLVVPRDLSLREFHHERQSYAIFHSSNTYRRTLSSINIWIQSLSGRQWKNIIKLYDCLELNCTFLKLWRYISADCAIIMPPFKKCFKKLEKCVTSSSVDLGKIEVKNFLCKRNIYIYIYCIIIKIRDPMIWDYLKKNYFVVLFSSWHY